MLLRMIRRAVLLGAVLLLAGSLGAPAAGNSASLKDGAGKDLGALR